MLTQVPHEMTSEPARMMMRWFIYLRRKGVIHWKALWNRFIADRPAYKSFTVIVESFICYYDATYTFNTPQHYTDPIVIWINIPAIIDNQRDRKSVV